MHHYLNKIGRRLSAIAFFVILFILSSCEKSSNSETQNLTLYDRLDKNLELKLFKFALNKTGYDKLLKESNKIVVFAPTDKAFANAGFPDELSLSKIPEEKLKNIVEYHVAFDKVKSDFDTDDDLTTLYKSSKLHLTKFSKYMVNGSFIDETNSVANNGKIFTIKTLQPLPLENLEQFFVENQEHSLFFEAIKKINFLDSIKLIPYSTLFIPNNTAMEKFGYSSNKIANLNSKDADEMKSVINKQIAKSRFYLSDVFFNEVIFTRSYLNEKFRNDPNQTPPIVYEGIWGNAPSFGETNIIVKRNLRINNNTIIHTINSLLY